MNATYDSRNLQNLVIHTNHLLVKYFTQKSSTTIQTSIFIQINYYIQVYAYV